MASLRYGLYKDLGDEPVFRGVAANATWDQGAFLKLSSGYLTACSAGDVPYGVARDRMTTAMSPATSGDVVAGVFVGPNNHYRYPPDAGTVAITDVFKKMDVGGARSVNIDASTDSCLICIDVDTTNNELIVQLIPAAAAGA